MGLYLLDYGAGNVQSLANSIKKLGHAFQWISSPEDFDKATSLIFPGVGAFESAIDGLISRGLYEPLREYIASGKPYFGICIGMQVLFRSSLESPTSTGLGIVPSDIGLFSNVDKSVPHMGWNSVEFLDPAETAHEGIDPAARYYFVHSFRAPYDWEHAEAAQWAHTTTQYGQEVFLASVRKGNVFACQFHPEKSGKAGLRVLDAWLRSSEAERATSPPTPRVARHPKPKDGFTKRVVACMDVRSNDAGDLVVTKGDQYDVRERTGADGIQTQAAGEVRNLGKPVALAARYYEEGADELCLMNITSFRHSPLLDQPMLAVVRAAAETVYVPLTIGGGIKDTVDPDGTPHSALEVAGTYFRAGADKVSVATEAVFAVEKMRTRPSADGIGEGDGTSAIETIAHAYGRQAVVVSVDPRRVYVDADYNGPYKDELVFGKPDGTEKERGRAWWYQCTVRGGREDRPLSVAQLVKGVEKLGAGEILLNSIDRDGTGLGFDLDLVALVRRSVRIPVVASSGAGRAAHFVEVFEKTGVEAALAAGIFHRREVGIDEVKAALTAADINVRTA
ncbi:imidazole glycerol phosphate synthase HisHF [Trametes versicolor FP-101664 SS1]|uniref:imidazole glycerol phosphate synthase HisHF n=1 Tax=Trametes versicolor (strain FP-101664) TaxID=717944 RepID=UPI0004622E30|nr:imidazole glycerol phosphate synthase HisHF [Trametes versicolor FP-101664 SS1]EIW64575.1 imidazole glycerol phosphate synthase HisHF [Trametes versicolor FP-101664 SS1]